MRKIEQAMANAVAMNTPWYSGSTTYAAETDQATGGVYLHGNLIATVEQGVVAAVPDTFRDWPTPTTASRLRALGFNATIKDGRACIDGEPV